MGNGTSLSTSLNNHHTNHNNNRQQKGNTSSAQGHHNSTSPTGTNRKRGSRGSRDSLHPEDDHIPQSPIQATPQCLGTATDTTTTSNTNTVSGSSKQKSTTTNTNNRTISAITDQTSGEHIAQSHDSCNPSPKQHQQHKTNGTIQSFTSLSKGRVGATTTTQKTATSLTKRMLNSLTPAPRSGNGVMITDALEDVRLYYHIEPKELGHGHYGIVRKCSHRETNKLYAIKSIRKSKVSKIEVLKREIEILKEVKHPHIIELKEVFEDERYLHLITEICTGGELFDRIIAKTQSVEGHFSEHDAAQLVHDILDAIRYCHDEKGIVHRDLKPENFLFLTNADDAPVKIIDFGLSRHDTASGHMKTMVGTPYYVAPEVLCREYTKSCDIWSIGVITYILLCGYPPFYGDNDKQIFDAVRVGRFDFPSPEWDDISQTAKEFVLSMLQKESRNRPTAAEALRHKWLAEQIGDQTSGINKDNATAKSITMKSVRTGHFANYLAMKRLRKVVLTYIAANLTQTEVGTLKELFETMDTNKEGSISLVELDGAIARGNFSPKILHDLRQLRADHAVMIDGVDKLDNEVQKIDWREFVASTMDRSVALRDQNVRMAFEHFRHSNSDYITIDDLADTFGSEAHANEVMDMLDIDHDGKISYENFRLALVESMDNDTDDDTAFESTPITLNQA